MLTLQGVKKPVFHACRMLHELGDQDVARECQMFGGKKKFEFRITGLVPGETYLLRILHKEDIAVTLWNEMGAPAAPDREQERLLREQGEVLEEVPFAVNGDGELSLSFFLDSWSIAQLR